MAGSSNQQLNDEEVHHLSLLLGIINSQNWGAFAHAVLSNPGAFGDFVRKLPQSSELNGMTILHACLRFNPPPAIVQALIELAPESPTCADCLKRTPLHIAAGTRASPPVIEMLVAAFPGACDVQDEDGKTPLHLACDNECELFEGDRGSRREPSSYEVVATLINASPVSVPAEDQNGMSALEHAIFSDSPIEVVKLLQYATGRQSRAQERYNLVGKLALDQEQPSPGTAETENESSSETLIPEMKIDYSSRKRIGRRNRHAVAA